MPPSRPDTSFDHAAVLAALRSRVARLDGAGRALHAPSAIPVCAGLPLPGGGLARATVHEVLATSPGCGAAFCALLLARTGGTVLWIATGRDGLLAWPPGLAQFGLDPADLVLVRARHWPDALWAMEEALRCPAVTGAVLAGDGPLDLTATRRLQLAAETGGALGLLLQPDRTSAAHTAVSTRWRIGSLAVEDGLADPRWLLELLRGHCQVVGVVDAFERAVRNPTSLRGPLDARLLPPDPECLGAGIAVLSGGHQMPPRTEVAIDHCVGMTGSAAPAPAT
ncbi:hypothetical protein GCM10011504_51610 [Siccirubricoccus deserti]|nr:hypothetical protein GCM10011504_51610 [Siccirubricoccus deserti]